MGQGFLPLSDAKLLEFANNASTLITATPTVFGVTSSFATSFASATSDYSDKLSLATGDATKGKVATANKNVSRDTLRQLCRDLNTAAQAHPGITPGQLTSLGLTVRKTEPSPQPAPALAPVVTTKSVTGRIVRGNLRDATTESSRRRPINAKGATIFIAWGPTPPVSTQPGWVTAGQTGRTTFVVQFPDNVPGGVPCYISAVWYNERGEYSPASEPITVYLSAPAGDSEEAGNGEESLKIAA